MVAKVTSVRCFAVRGGIVSSCQVLQFSFSLPKVLLNCQIYASEFK